VSTGEATAVNDVVVDVDVVLLLLLLLLLLGDVAGVADVDAAVEFATTPATRSLVETPAALHRVSSISIARSRSWMLACSAAARFFNWDDLQLQQKRFVDMSSDTFNRAHFISMLANDSNWGDAGGEPWEPRLLRNASNASNWLFILRETCLRGAENVPHLQKRQNIQPNTH
jgi:hypothetical protein